jgi:hypothetical protein
MSTKRIVWFLSDETGSVLADLSVAWELQEMKKHPIRALEDEEIRVGQVTNSETIMLTSNQTCSEITVSK